ncbi:MAG: hypothetical protein HY370_07360 [Proteobacteria bacterium]|nr:hypothetical protein [Pseudomonadota bacterium]
MSREYAENRIKEALKLSKGNPTKARQQIIAWTYEDTKLLHALARPHLTGIVAHAVNRVIYHQSMEDEEQEVHETPRSLDMEPETFGAEIMKALQSDNTSRFGREGGAPVPRPKQVSQSHIDALKAMSSKKKKD